MRLRSRLKFKALKDALMMSAGLSALINLPLDLWFKDKYVIFSREALQDYFYTEDQFLSIINNTAGALAWQNPIVYNFLVGTFFFAIIMYRINIKAIETQEKGDIVRGVQLIEDPEEFTKKVKEKAKEDARKLEMSASMEAIREYDRAKRNNEEVSKKSKIINMPHFYTARIFFTHKKYYIPVFLFQKTAYGFINELKENILIFIYKHLSFLIKVTKIPLFQYREAVSFLLLGVAGSGKTNSFFYIITNFIKWQVDNNKQYAMVVYDRKQDFWKKLFRRSKDYLFFPPDKKSLKYNYFDEFTIQTINIVEADENGNDNIVFSQKCETIAESYFLSEEKKASLNSNQRIVIEKEILNGEKTNFHFAVKPKAISDEREVWDGKGRTVQDAVFITVAMNYDFPSPKNLIDFINQYPTKEALAERISELGFAKQYRSIEINALLDDTEAGQNAYQNFYATAKDLMKPVFYYPAQDCNFSVRMFAKELEPTYCDRRLFLVQDPNSETEYSTIFRAILEQLGKKVLSLSGDLDRRIMFVIDEAASLGNVDIIVNDLPEQGRSKGAMCIFGYQSLAQPRDIFGELKMETILGNVQNRIIMGTLDNFTLNWIQNNISQVELDKEHTSVNDENKGNLSMSYEKRDVLSISDLTTLSPSEGYLRIGNYIIKIFFDIPNLKNIDEFEPNESALKVIPVDFKEENEKVHKERRDKVIEGILHLMKKTNKPLSPENIALQSEVRLDKVKQIMAELVEQKGQIVRATEKVKSLNLNPDNKDLIIEAYKRITGLSEDEIIPILPPKKTFEKSIEPEKPKEVEVAKYKTYEDEEDFEEEKFPDEEIPPEFL